MTDLRKNSIRDGCNVIETIYQCIEISASLRFNAARKKGCTRCTIVYGAVNNPNCTGFKVIETIHVLKFQQIRGSLQLTRKVALDQIAYESEARSLKTLQIQGFTQFNEGTIDDGLVKNPNRAGCNVIETIWVLKFPQVEGSLQLARKDALDRVAYENEARSLKSLKILG